MADSTITATVATKEATIVGDWAVRETVDVTISLATGAFGAGTYTLALCDDISRTLLATTDAGGGSVALTLAGGTLVGSIDLNTTAAIAAYGAADLFRGHRTLRLYLWEAVAANLIIADDIMVDWTGYYAGMTAPTVLAVDSYTKAQIDGLLALYTPTAGLGDLATQDTINDDDWSGTDLAVANGGTGASNAADARDNLGLGDLSTQDTVNNGDWSGVDLDITNGGTGASTAAGARTNLGLEIDVNVQAYDAGLASAAAFPTAADKYIYGTAADTWAEGDITAAGRAILDDATAAAQRTTLTAERDGIVVAVGNTGATWAPDYDDGDYFTATVDQNTTIAVPANLSAGDGFVMRLTNMAAFVVTWAAGYLWAGGTAPTGTAAGDDVLVFASKDGATVDGVLPVEDSQ